MINVALFPLFAVIRYEVDKSSRNTIPIELLSVLPHTTLWAFVSDPATLLPQRIPLLEVLLSRKGLVGSHRLKLIDIDNRYTMYMHFGACRNHVCLKDFLFDFRFQDNKALG